MAPNRVASGGERAAPQLSSVQQRIQAARLGQAVPSLGAAYAQALARWLGDPVLRLAGVPFVTECYRSPERQDELYAQGRSKPGPVVTYKRGGESKHNRLPAPALDVAFLLPDGEVSWSGLLLSKFARLMKAADARVQPMRGCIGAATGLALRTGRILRSSVRINEMSRLDGPLVLVNRGIEWM